MQRNITEGGKVAARVVSESKLGDPKWADLLLGFLTTPNQQAKNKAWTYLSHDFDGTEEQFETLVAAFDDLWRHNGGGRLDG